MTVGDAIWMNHDSALEFLRPFAEELGAADMVGADKSDLWRALRQERCLSDTRHLVAAIEYAIKVLEKDKEARARITELEQALLAAQADAAAYREALEWVDAVHRSLCGDANELGDNLTPLQLFAKVRSTLSAPAPGAALLLAVRFLQEDIGWPKRAAQAFLDRRDILAWAPIKQRNPDAERRAVSDSLRARKLADAIAALPGTGEGEKGER